MSAKESEADDSWDVSPIRDAAKWLLTALAAVGAALLGGIQLSDIGGLEAPALLIGICGFGVAIVGIGIAIASTSSVLVTRLVSISQMRTDAEAKAFLAKNADVVGLEYDDFDEFLKDRDAAWREWKSFGSSTTQDADRKERVEACRKHLEHVEAMATRVARIWRFERVSVAFARSRRAIFVAVGVATAGIVLFTCAKQFDSRASLPRNPSAVEVTYSLSGEAYESLLNEGAIKCVRPSGMAILLDGWPGGRDVLIPPQSVTCAPLRLRWSDSVGTLGAMLTGDNKRD